ncbi:MAG: hypothetical protein ACKVJJ_05855 [Fidelibacterota bacterium]|jgi:hypothetical protein
MFKTKKEIELFYSGIEFFNVNDYENAHREWEVLWKIMGHKPRRLGLKVFLQLTGVYKNIVLSKWDAVRYGIRVATQRLSENSLSISPWVEVVSIESFLSKYENIKISLKSFDELILIKKRDSARKDLEAK